MNVLYAYFMVAIVLDHAHLVSPIGLAWSNPAFRQKVLREWGWFILLPAILFVVCVGIGVSADRHSRPLYAVMAVYGVWNAWHFGSQHFGVASLLGWRSGPRWLRQAALIGPTMLLMLAPIQALWLVLVADAVSLFHWATDIGLSSWKARRWYLLSGCVLLLGLSGFLFKGVVTTPAVCGPIPVCAGAISVPLLLSIRCGLGFVHFLYSQRLWPRSSPIWAQRGYA